MKSVPRVLMAGLAAALLGSATGSDAGVAAAPQAALERRPNIVFILIDDLGWADVGCFGSKYYETPNIDRLAGRGDAVHRRLCGLRRVFAHAGQHHDGQVSGPVAPDGLDSRRGQRAVAPAPRSRVAAVPAAGGGHHRPDAQVGRLRLGQPSASGTGRAGLLPRAPRFRSQRWRRLRLVRPPSYFWPYEGPNHAVPGLKAGGQEGEYLTDRLTDGGGEIHRTEQRPTVLPLFRPLRRAHPLAGQAGGSGKIQSQAAVGGQNNPVYAAMIESVDHSVGRIRAQAPDAWHRRPDRDRVHVR